MTIEQLKQDAIRELQEEREQQAKTKIKNLLNEIIKSQQIIAMQEKNIEAAQQSLREVQIESLNLE